MRFVVDQNVQSLRQLVKRLGNVVALSGECGCDAVQFADGRDDVVALLAEYAHETVQAAEQVANDVLAPGQGEIEVVHDIADLPQATRVDHRGQRRERLLGRRIRRRAPQRYRRAGL